ncbi:hypothetical protein F7734_05775 [Scytonema sp. UIC 10036]|uniref:hypothetical protein n=1 Tax=Scytonema sp. UIC 10036 TaxID=2304196 RepID=UPI0012DAB262|nr:hypothetical protein [Scytonema sp. UIC 10036]MUG91994.1 hypothetical protein [Scytonema sp. UIC 10036]
MSTGKGLKRIKNQPVLHSSLKKQKNLWLTIEIWDLIKEEATKNQLSCSEYVEQKLRECHGR